MTVPSLNSLLEVEQDLNQITPLNKLANNTVKWPEQSQTIISLIYKLLIPLITISIAAHLHNRNLL